MKKSTFLIILGLLFIMCFGLSGCGNEKAVGTSEGFSETKELNDPSIVIAVETGTLMESAAKTTLPDASYIYVNSASDGYLAVQTGKADAYAGDAAILECAQRGGLDGLTAIGGQIGEIGYVAAGVSPETEIKDAKKLIDDFLAEMEAQGIMEEMYQRWVVDGNYEMPDIPLPENPQRRIKAATTGLLEPYTFYMGDTLTGFDIELINRFAVWADAQIEISTYDWTGIIPACASGKVDYVLSDLFMTEERKEEIYFSVPYCEVATTIIVAETAAAEEGRAKEKSFFQSVKQSFIKTFLIEDRWKLVLSGLGSTVLISLLAALAGTILGFGICLLRRGKNRVFVDLSKAFIRIIQGIPIVVLLMILYYIVFAASDLNGILIASIGFAVNFGVYVAEQMRISIDAVDRGQWEAADALGFGRVKTFTNVVAPQALRHILPVYKGEFISMVKMTSVVGYISIQDLTRASDIIRSRTYEAFFPLVATAIIYFLLAWVLTLLLGRIEVGIDPKTRTRNPKGVNCSAAEKEVDKKGTAAAVKPAETGEEVIHIAHLKKVYPNVTPLSDVTADIRRGEVVTIIGPSGTGKSTLLRCLNRLETPTEGSIVVFGQDMGDKRTDISRLRQQMGMVFQSFNLFPHLTIIENIMLAPVKLKKEAPQAAYQRGIALLRSVGLAEKALSYPEELSGGQRQRAAIARTLAMKPEIVLFDEPTSALDPTMVGEVLSVIRKLAAEGLTMMIVTHEMKFAQDVSTRIFYMDEGVIYESGTPAQIFDHPQRDKTRAFVKRLKVTEYHIVSQDYDFIGMNEALRIFGEKHFMSLRQITNMQRCFEELVAQNVIPHLGEHFDLTVMVEYTEETGQLDMRFEWEGVRFDPLAEGDPLSLLVLRTAMKSGECFYENGRNRIWITM